MISREGRFSWVNRAMVELNGGRIPMRFTSAPLRRDGHIVEIFSVGMICALVRAMGAHSRFEVVLMASARA